MTRRELGQLIAGALAAGMGVSAFTQAAPSTTATTGWRKSFPALKQSIAGQPLVYLDSAATTQRPRAVLDALLGFYENDNANPGKTQHTLARRAYERYEAARQTLARFINAPHVEEIVWVRGTTEAINLVASTWARAELRTGDEILLTVAEHASNLLPWRFAAERAGAHLRFVEVDDDGRISLEDLDRKLSAKTRLLAFSHVSNVAGYINPAAEICARARRAGARTLIDAAQSAPHIALDVQALGCDFAAFSSHKMLGPMGVGVLWARTELLEAMPPYQAGSNMAHAVDFETAELEHAALRFGAGTPNAAGPIALAAAVDYVQSLGMDAVHAHEADLTTYTLDRLSHVPGLRVLGPTSAIDRVPVFAFDVAGIAPLELQRDLDARGIAIRAGDLSALPLLKHFGVSTAARASCYLYTTRTDIDRLIDGLERAISARSRATAMKVAAAT
jgi:cysteine desulfurase/selenocysteine lyase